MIRKNGFTFGPEAMAGNIGKFPRTREGKKADQMTKVLPSRSCTPCLWCSKHFGIPLISSKLLIWGTRAQDNELHGEGICEPPSLSSVTRANNI